MAFASYVWDGTVNSVVLHCIERMRNTHELLLGGSSGHAVRNHVAERFHSDRLSPAPPLFANRCMAAVSANTTPKG